MLHVSVASDLRLGVATTRCGKNREENHCVAQSLAVPSYRIGFLIVQRLLAEGFIMVTAPIFSSTPSGTQSKSNSNLNLQPMDFINLMVTQLQQQDPTKPADNSQLLAQMSQIGSCNPPTRSPTASRAWCCRTRSVRREI